jgi:hypothetical protein
MKRTLFFLIGIIIALFGFIVFKDSDFSIYLRAGGGFLAGINIRGMIEELKYL